MLNTGAGAVQSPVPAAHPLPGHPFKKPRLEPGRIRRAGSAQILRTQGIIAQIIKFIAHAVGMGI
jgi:hypothetical protein